MEPVWTTPEAMLAEEFNQEDEQALLDGEWDEYDEADQRFDCEREGE